MNYDKYLENEKDTETAVTMGVIYPVAEGEFNLPTSILKRKALISSHYILQTGASHDYSFITLMVHGEVRSRMPLRYRFSIDASSKQHWMIALYRR